MTNFQQNKPKKKITKADAIGMSGGFFIVAIIFQISSFGLIPNFIIAMCSFLIVKKIAQFFLKKEKNNPQKHDQEHNNKSVLKITQNEEKNTEIKKSKKGQAWVGAIIIIFTIVSVIAVFSDPNNEKDMDLIQADKSGNYSEQDGNLYRNTEYNFRIKFPEGWDIKSGDGPNILQKAVNGNHTISILVQEIPAEHGDKTATIKDIMSLIEFKNTFFEGMQEKFSDIELVDFGESKLDNEPAYWIKYSAPYTTLDITVQATNLQYQVLNNNILYTINAGSTSNEFDTVETEFMKSIATFVIEDY
ncbi:hypothetical protein KAS41_03900 [Candidatus Parcubacteria bacterium]|nr:hypothetical protein [Candidatus Parcubacteria bacterium]